MGLDTGASVTPVIPVILRDPVRTMRLNRFLLDQGIYASPVVHPGVAPTESRIRLGVMATHTPGDLERCLEVFGSGLKRIR